MTEESLPNASVSIDEIIKIVDQQINNSKWFPTLPKHAQLIFRGEPSLYETALFPTVFRLEHDKQFFEAYLYEEFQRAYPQYFNSCQNELDWLSVM
jgi:hypothetical protein